MLDFFLNSARDQTYGLVHAKQVLYYQAASLAIESTLYHPHLGGSCIHQGPSTLRLE
jgi:hypothetical protein